MKALLWEFIRNTLAVYGAIDLASEIIKLFT